MTESCEIREYLYICIFLFVIEHIASDLRFEQKNTHIFFKKTYHVATEMLDRFEHE